MHCARLNNDITTNDCSSIIWNTQDRSDLITCRNCSTGIALMQLCPWNNSRAIRESKKKLENDMQAAKLRMLFLLH